MTLNNDIGPRVVPVGTQGAGSLASPGGGYPDAPYAEPVIDHSAQMGMQVMSRCVNCGLAVKPEELGTHTQEEGFASDFGVREWVV